MQKKVWLLVLPLILASCGGTSSSTSSSSSSSSLSSEEPFHPGRRIEGKGNLTYDLTTHFSGESTRYKGKVDGLSANISLDKMPTVLSDLFDPGFYQYLAFTGSFYFDELTYSTTKGKTTNTTTIAKSTIDTYMKDGDLYVDTSDVERTSVFSIVDEYLPKKIKVVKPFANASEYDPDIPLPISDLPSLLLGAVDFEALDPFLDLEPFDSDTLKISFQITLDSIERLVEVYAPEQTIPEDIDKYFPNLDPSNLSFYYNLAKEKVTRFDLKLGMDIDFSKYIESLASYIDPVHLTMDMQMPITGIDNVDLPALESYSEIDWGKIDDLLKRLEELIPSQEQSSSQETSSQGGE